MTKKISSLSCFMFAALFFVAFSFVSCEKDEEGDTEINGNNNTGTSGYAPNDIDKGYQLDFYNLSSSWQFGISIYNDVALPVLQNGAISYEDPIYIYKKTGNNIADFYVFISYSYILGGEIYYGTHYYDMKLTFSSSTGGSYAATHPVKGTKTNGTFKMKSYKP